MLPGLDAILAPPAGGVGAACGSSQVLSGQAVVSLQLVEPGGEALVGPCHRGVRFLLFGGAVLAVARPRELLSYPVLGVCPRPLGEVALDVGQRSWERELSLGDGAVRVGGGCCVRWREWNDVTKCSGGQAELQVTQRTEEDRGAAELLCANDDRGRRPD